ncbi:MAG TPA: SGNH/GDSL hydrolase family protein [Candidatus Polarisedimenticolia bacterium]|nr:SGNH/GDSL hydrolase family protein [Candidatus Polarisedimenticolia bacterium]
MPTAARLAPLVLLLMAWAGSAQARQVTGQAYEDRDADGIRDPGEPLLEGLEVRLFGKPSASPLVDAVVPTGGDGAFAFSPGAGCYLLAPAEPAGWRLGPARWEGVASSTPGYTHPVGRPRASALDLLAAGPPSGTFLIAAMGDSIARNANLCTFPESFWYTTQSASRLGCAAPSAAVAVDRAAVLGQHTDDLLVDDHDDLNNVFRAIERQPSLVTLSMIGNDLLAVDPGSSPTPAQITRAWAEIVDARRNLQEALSAMTSEIPGAAIVLNTLYDNEAYNCATGSPGAFHRAWLPIVNRMLREMAWGLARRASIAEAGAELAHENQAGACLGFTGQICRDLFGLDNIHPTQQGYTVLREKLWESFGGVLLGSQDPLGRTSRSVDYGYLRRVRRLLPRSHEARGGALVAGGAAAHDDQDGGASASIQLGGAGQEAVFSSFPDWYDEIQIVKVIAGVRYATSGVVNDDAYRMEASLTGQFGPPPGFVPSPTTWDIATPIVGGGGPDSPPENPDYPSARLLVLPDVDAPREVTATLTKNPLLPAGAADYQWPAVTHEDLATTAIRVASAPLAGTPGNDAYAVELDAVWLDLYGWEKPRPPEASMLEVAALPGGALALSFQPVPGAQRHNLYTGSLSSLSAGIYDHGPGAPAGPFCAVASEDAGTHRVITLESGNLPPGDAYFLVTAHVDDVESPAGLRSSGEEIDRSRSVCR